MVKIIYYLKGLLFYIQSDNCLEYLIREGQFYRLKRGFIMIEDQTTTTEGNHIYVLQHYHCNMLIDT